MTHHPHSPLIVLAAGGTGGHVFPAEALASILLSRGYRLALVTDRRGAVYGGTLGSLQTYRVQAGAVAGRSLRARLKAFVALGCGVFQAMSILRAQAPAAVIGFGGYASVPTVVAAILLGIPTAVHEQNAVLGRANRLLASYVQTIATSYDQVQRLPKSAKITLTGMPVRPAVAAVADQPYQTPDVTQGPLRLLIMGGSQGARVLSDVLPQAIAQLDPALKSRLDISQQCRPEDLESVKAAYAHAGITATLASFFSDVPERMANAHLVIARSGASTLAEITALGRPALLVPYPYSADNDQHANAMTLAGQGGAWCIPQDQFTPDTLAHRLTDLFAHPLTLADTAERARLSGRPDAALRLADAVETLFNCKDAKP